MQYNGAEGEINKCKLPSALPQRTWALWGRQGPHRWGGGPWALWGPRGPRRARGAPQGAPQARGNTGKRSGAIFGKPGFWVPGGPPSNPEKVCQNRLPSLRDLSQSLRAAFLVQVGTKNPSRPSMATQVMKSRRPGSWNSDGDRDLFGDWDFDREWDLYGD